VRAEPGQEAAISFACEGELLVGVLSMPTPPSSGKTSDLALLVVVGGPQVRAGSHRQFTTLCRAVAAAGVPAMRFDVRGMGDSSGPLHTFEHIGPDIGAALDALQARLPQVRRVVLWGLCDGASAALLYVNAHQTERLPDARVAGLVQLNPWVRSTQTLAQAHVKHYYWNRVRHGSFWSKLMRGGIAMKALKDLLRNLRAARDRPVSAAPGAGPTDTPVLPFQERMLKGAEGFAGPVLWLLSGCDYTAKEFSELAASQPRWRAVLQRAGKRLMEFPEADHTFSNRTDEQAMIHATVRWLVDDSGLTP
jgi:exosortase A-associated hydrolase 1